MTFPSSLLQISLAGFQMPDCPLYPIPHSLPTATSFCACAWCGLIASPHSATASAITLLSLQEATAL